MGTNSSRSSNIRWPLRASLPPLASRWWVIRAKALTDGARSIWIWTWWGVSMEASTMMTWTEAIPKRKTPILTRYSSPMRAMTNSMCSSKRSHSHSWDKAWAVCRITRIGHRRLNHRAHCSRRVYRLGPPPRSLSRRSLRISGSLEAWKHTRTMSLWSWIRGVVRQPHPR